MIFSTTAAYSTSCESLTSETWHHSLYASGTFSLVFIRLKIPSYHLFDIVTGVDTWAKWDSFFTCQTAKCTNIFICTGFSASRNIFSLNSHSKLHSKPVVTYMLWVNLQLIKVVQNSFVLHVHLPILLQTLQELIPSVTRVFHQTFWKVLYSVCQKVVWCLQGENKLWKTHRGS